MRKSLQLSPSLIILSAWDILKARLFLLTTLSYLIILPILLLQMIALSWNRAGTVFIMAPLWLLLVHAMITIGRWCAQTEKDIRNGNPTGFRQIWHRTRRSPFHSTLAKPPFFWNIVSILTGLLTVLLNISPLVRLTPILYLLLPILTPIGSLIVITKTRLSAEFSGSLPTEIPAEQIESFNTDRTRPMSSFAPPFADETVSAVASTNPAGFKWTPENRQALLADILSGHISAEEAGKRYGIEAEELQGWLNDFMKRDQSPKPSGREIPGDNGTTV